MGKTLGLHFLKGILAGLSIGLGGFLYIILCFAIPGEVGKILGSIAFAVGLFLVCTFGLSLYTGKIGIVYEGKQEKSFYFALPIMLLGNAIGAVGLGLLCYVIFRSTSVMDTVNAVVAVRTKLGGFDDYLSLCLKSFLCGFCVYVAVKLFNLNRLKPLGILGLVFFVFLFVYCGFQHCIANMFYFGFGGAYSWEVLANLGLCILFNSFGPILGVALFKLFKRN